MTSTADDLRAAIDSNPKIRRITKTHYRDAVARWEAFAGSTDKQWTTRRAQTFYNGLLESLKPQSANAILYGLRYAFGRLAALEQDPDVDIMKVVILQPGDKAEHARVMTEAEARRLCDARRAKPKVVGPHHLRDFAFAVVGLQTGMRRMSFASIKIDRVESTAIKEVVLKGGKKYDVPLSKTARAAVEPYAAWLRSRGVESGPLFRRIRSDLKPGPGLSIRGIDALVDRLTADAKVRNISPHSFRHTFVTWAREAGAQPFEIAAVTGHASEEYVGGQAGIIEDIYTARERSGAKAADLIARGWMKPG